MKKIPKYVHLDLFYVLDYSGCFDMHIEYYKKTPNFFQKSATGGGAQNVTNRSLTIFYAFPYL